MLNQMQDQVSFIAGAVLAGIVLFISYKLIYEWRANRALAGKKVRFALPSLKIVMLMYGALIFCLLFYMVQQQVREQKNVCPEGGVINRQVLNTELSEMKEKIQAYHEEHEGNLYIQEMRDDPYFDLIMYQNSEDDAYLLLIRPKETFRIDPDHYYRLYFVSKNKVGSASSWTTISGSELQDGFFAFESGEIRDERCGLITNEYRVVSFGNDPDGKYLDHTLSVQVRKEVHEQ